MQAEVMDGIKNVSNFTENLSKGVYRGAASYFGSLNSYVKRFLNGIQIFLKQVKYVFYGIVTVVVTVVIIKIVKCIRSF